MKTILLLFWAIFSLPYNNNCSGVGEKLKNELTPSIDKKHNILRMSSPWILDLEKTYEIGFAHQFGHLKYRQNLTVPNHNIPRDVSGTCQNVSVRSFHQNRRLIRTFGYEPALNSTIYEMLDNPRARLFEFPDHWGAFEDYRFLRSKRIEMCFDLVRVGRRVGSAFTFGRCVRLFEMKNCRGWSLAIYPGCSNSYGFVVPRHVTFQSIGPCLKNEFSGGFLNKSFPSFVVKNPEIRNFQPDLVMLFNPHIVLGPRKHFGGVTAEYLLGTGNRTELLKVTPGPRDSVRLIPNFKVEEGDFQKSLEKEEGDVLGLAIPLTGGIQNKSFNIFTVNQSALNEWENVLLSHSRHNPWNNSKFSSVVFQFEYESENKTRPLFFYYYMNLYNFVYTAHGYTVQHGRTYGRIINGHKTNIIRDKPYHQVIPKFLYKGTAKINLTQVLKRHREVFEITDSFYRSAPPLQNFNRLAETQVTNWQTYKYKNFTDEEYLKENFTVSLPLESHIKDMIKSRMVRLFSGENLTDQSKDYHSGQYYIAREKSCHYHPYRLEIVKSAETFGTCVRLFQYAQCKGLSLAIYAGNEYSNRTIDTILDQVTAVGPCLENEFTNATFVDQRKRLVAKDRNSSSYFPDLVLFGGRYWHNPQIFRRSDDKDVYYGVGPKNRIEYISTWFGQVGLAQVPKGLSVEETEFYKSLDKRAGDVPCFAIPLRFYGPDNEAFNVFPVSLSKIDDWLGIFPSSSDVYELHKFRIELNFVYENDKTTRPQFVYYYFSSPEVYYGRFVNS